ncbi:MAG: hypothetical protein H7Z19_17100 [Chitinophagaceae bacterium]|nr:hypothetical protein [Rubrivivax sp.]
MTPTTLAAAAAAPAPAAPPWQGLVFSLLLLVMALQIYIPLAPDMPHPSLDGSWQYAMNEAMARGMAIGRDLIFTAGPYAALYTLSFHPATDTMALWSGALMALSMVGACMQLGRGSAWWWQPLLMVALAATAAVHARDAIFYAHPLLVATVALACWPSPGLDRAARRRRRLWMMLLLAPLGLLPLIKGSFMVASLGVAVLCAGLLWHRRQRPEALLCLAVPAIAMLVLWLAAGQAATDLPDYLRNMRPVISGYSEAMSIYGWPREVRNFLMLGAALLLVVALQRRFSGPERAFYVGALGLLLFVVFKGGFVRHDGHSMIAAVTLLLATIAAAAVFKPRWTLPLVLMAAGLWWYFMSHHARPVDSATQSFRFLYDKGPKGLMMRLTDPGALRREFDARVASLRQDHPLPLLPGTVDIYPHHQTALLASGNRWAPRPVLQSYSAYTAALAAMNRDHLLGPAAADHLIFGIDPIDQRYPSLDDGASWPVLLSHYRVRAWAGSSVVLQRRPDPQGLPEATAAASLRSAPSAPNDHAFGERVEVPSAPDGHAQWVQIHSRPTMPGRLMAALYKPIQLRIEVTLADGTQRNLRLLPALARDGFLLSPLVESTREFGFLFGGHHHLADKAVRSFVIAPLESKRHGWNMRYSVTFSMLPLPADPVVSPPPEVFESAAADLAGLDILPEGRCLGSIDSVNGGPPTSAGLSARGVLKVQGWLDDTTHPVYLVMQDARGQRRFMATRRAPRQDVANHLGRPELALSGWAAVLDVAELRGPFTIGVAVRRAGRIELCPQFAVPLALRAPPDAGAR